MLSTISSKTPDGFMLERQLVVEGHRQQQQNGAAKQERKGESSTTRMTEGDKDTGKGVVLGLVVEEANGGGDEGEGGGVDRGSTWPRGESFSFNFWL